MRKRSLEEIAASIRKRGHSRKAAWVALHYTVRIDDGRRLIAGTMTNVTLDGFRIALEESVPAGTPVMLIRGEHATPALVRWSEGLEIGAVLTDTSERPER
jgi:hypothetical protein